MSTMRCGSPVVELNSVTKRPSPLPSAQFHASGLASRWPPFAASAPAQRPFLAAWRWQRLARLARRRQAAAQGAAILTSAVPHASFACAHMTKIILHA